MSRSRQNPDLGDPLDAMPWASQSRRRRGQSAHFSGLAAEDAASRTYVQRGAREIGRRVRTPYGEIDLVIEHDGTLIFVEVKRRKKVFAFDNPISVTQWERLKNAALHYMLPILSETGVQPACRFDVVLMDHAGQLTVIENACSFDEH